METTKNQSFKVWIGCTLLAALTVVLQFIAGTIKIGEFNLTFSLIPIVIAAMFYGVKGGVIVGTTFGLTILVQCIIGFDPGGYYLFNLNPVFTTIACVVRTFLVGLLLGLIYLAIRKAIKNTFVQSLILSVAAPVLNTGIFLILYALMFNDLLMAAAAENNTDVWSFIIFAFVGMNFLIEILTTAILCPPIVKALEAIRKRI